MKWWRGGNATDGGGQHQLLNESNSTASSEAIVNYRITTLSVVMPQTENEIVLQDPSGREGASGGAGTVGQPRESSSLIEL